MGGLAIHPINAPSGHTGTDVPFTVSPASPFPTDPKMKLESRDVISDPSGGYTTVMCNGPFTSGTGGSFGLGGGNGARTRRATGVAGGVAAGTGATVTGTLFAHAAAIKPTQIAKESRTTRRILLR
jgi:hypothetical protein